MRNICWPAWLSAIALVAFVLTTAGCQSAEPLVPREVYQQVNDDGREWTYDTAWQNIRKLNADLEARNLESIAEDSLFIVSQMERLEKGNASGMSSRALSRLIDVEAMELGDSTEALSEIRSYGRKLQESFDAGDFERAKDQALMVYALATQFAETK